MFRGGIATGCHRDQGRWPARLEEGGNVGGADPRGLPEIRGKIRRLTAQGFHAAGVLGRWEDPYLTMSAAVRSRIAGAFVDFLDQGYVYKGLKPVNWCIHDRTALAEAEVEYENHSSPSIWVRFALTTDPAAIDPALAGKKVWGLIWTTTPWTIPANLAIAFHPQFTYAAVEVGGRCLYRRARFARSDGGSLRLGSAASARGIRGREAERDRVPASFPGRDSSASWAITSRWSRAPARSTRLRATARKTT